MRNMSIHTLLVPSLLVITSCAMEVGSEDDGTGDIGLAQSELSGGTTLSNEEYTGIVRLKYRYRNKDFIMPYTHCTGTLLTNNQVMTAEHCIDDFSNSEIFVQMGSQTASVADRRVLVDKDVAILKLSRNLKMWNWHVDGFTGSRRLNYTDYQRPLSQQSSNYYDGRSLLCFGHGGNAHYRWNPDPPLTYASFDVKYSTYGLNPVNALHFDITNGPRFIAGDSGGPCLDGFSTYASPVVSTLSGCFDDFCYADGIDEYLVWTQLVMYYFATN